MVWYVADILSVALAAAMFIVTVVTYFVSRVVKGFTICKEAHLQQVLEVTLLVRL